MTLVIFFSTVTMRLALLSDIYLRTIGWIVTEFGTDIHLRNLDMLAGNQLETRILWYVNA